MTPPNDKPEDDGKPSEITIDLGAYEPMVQNALVAALRKVADEAGLEITMHSAPPTPCEADSVHEPTGISLGNQTPNNAQVETDTQHSEDILALQRADFEINDGWLSIEEPHFFGECTRSPNGRFVLAWGEGAFGADGRQGKAHYLLFDGTNIVARGTMKRPAEGIVADNGNFVLNDWAEDSANTAHVFDCGGELIFKKKAESWAGICGISADGRFVIWEIMDDDFRADSASGTPEFEGGNAWQVFDPTTRKNAGKIHTVLGEATSQQIDSENQIVTFAYSNGLTHRYAFDGTFLDAAAWQTTFRDHVSGYELLRVAEERLPSLSNGDASAIADVIDLLSRALTQEISEYTQARVHRHLGELRLQCGDKAGAIEHLECATLLYPKIGVKKLLTSLKKTGTEAA